MTQAISADHVWDYFMSHGWHVVRTTPLEMRFRNGQDMPEGMWREAVVSIGFTHHILAVYVVAWNDERRQFNGEVTFDTEPNLAGLLGSLGPASFSHIIEAFRRQVMGSVR